MIDLFNFEKIFYNQMKHLFSISNNSYTLKVWENGKLIYDSNKPDKNVKPNNNAPKSIKGDYNLSIHGNKIVLTDTSNGTTIETRCHPDDNFDIGIGIEESFKKINEKRMKPKEEKINVGDWIEVTNWKKEYNTHVSWLYDKVAFNYIRLFDYGRFAINGTKGKVIAIDTSKDNGKTILAFCTKNSKVYIINVEGVRKVEN